MKAKPEIRKEVHPSTSEPGPEDRDGEAQQPHKEDRGADGEPDGEGQRDGPPEPLAGVGAQDHEQDERDGKAQRVQQQAEEHGGPQDQGRLPESELAHRRPGADEGAQHHGKADQRQEQAEHRGEVRGPHAHRGSHGMVAPQGDGCASHRKKDDTGP